MIQSQQQLSQEKWHGTCLYDICLYFESKDFFWMTCPSLVVVVLSVPAEPLNFVSTFISRFLPNRLCDIPNFYIVPCHYRTCAVRRHRQQAPWWRSRRASPGFTYQTSVNEVTILSSGYSLSVNSHAASPVTSSADSKN